MAYKKRSRRTFKKRAFGRRRRFTRKRRGSNNASWTSQGSTTARGVSFKGRKMGLRKWRSKLWNDTLAKSHYRSVQAVVTTFTTGTTPGFGNLDINHPEFGATSANPFWTVTGGLELLDLGSLTPTFLGDITLRGGKVGITVSVADAVTDSIAVNIYLMFKMKRPVASATIFPVAEALGFDPSGNADVNESFGTVLGKRTGVIDYQNKTITYEHRVKPRKIDQATFTANGAQFCFVVHAVNVNAATDVTVNTLKYHNLSFSADISAAA